MIILYFETCYVASMVSPGGVVVVTPAYRLAGDVGSSPIRGSQPIFFRRVRRKENDAHILICSIPFNATCVFLLSCYIILLF